jgi:cephalosporin hydroxylase
MADDVPQTGSAVPYDLLMTIQKGTMDYRYRGIPTLKNPFDLALYPMLLEQTKPRTLMEIGSYKGGSALWFSDLAARLGFPMEVYSIDVAPPADVTRPGITFLTGDAQDLGATLKDELLESLPRPWLVIDDADHSRSTTLAVLRFFDKWLRPGEYIVVEDGIVTDMRVPELYDGGPRQAIQEFLRAHGDRYAIDRTYCDYFGHNVTWNVDGFLRRER